MNKKEAIEFLKQSLGEIRTLLRLPHDNHDYPLWHKTIEGVLEGVFGQDSGEHRGFSGAQHNSFLDDSQQEGYLKELKLRETALLAIINKHAILGIEESPAKAKPTKESAESPIHLFDKMQLHPRIIKASKSLFNSGHYAEAIFAAFKAVNNFTKRKIGQPLDGKDLMAKAFNEDSPIIKINKLTTRSERDEQEGFRFLFMGAMVGIRNPKAHDDIRQIDPYKALEYLAFASLLMRRVIEGKVVKTKPPRTRWDWERFLTEIQGGCDSEIVDLARNLYEFTRSNSDSISWGTGTQDGSFTFRKLGLGGMTSIFSIYSYGWVYINFGSMKNKNVPDGIMESFRVTLNNIPNINLPKEAVIEGKYSRIHEKPLTRSKNLKHFKDAVISLCQQLENSKEQS